MFVCLCVCLCVFVCVFVCIYMCVVCWANNVRTSISSKGLYLISDSSKAFREAFKLSLISAATRSSGAGVSGERPRALRRMPEWLNSARPGVATGVLAESE